MKRCYFAGMSLVGIVLLAGNATADWGGPVPPGSPSGPPPLPGPGQIAGPNTLFGLGAPAPGKNPDQYGLLPGLRRAFRTGGSSSSGGGCATPGYGYPGMGQPGYGGYNPAMNWPAAGYGQGGPAYNPAGYPGYGPGAPPVQQGTLVFPNHPYVRSPRDFFMYGSEK